MNDSDIMTASRLRFLLLLRDHPAKAAHSRFKRQREWARKRGYAQWGPNDGEAALRNYRLVLTEAGKARMEKEYTA